MLHIMPELLYWSYDLLAPGYIRISWLPYIYYFLLVTWLGYPTIFMVPVNIVLLFYYTEGNSGCIYLDDGEWGIWYIYIWGFSWLDYSFNINLMNPKSEPVQIVLSILNFIALLEASDNVWVCMCSRHDFWHIASN